MAQGTALERAQLVIRGVRSELRVDEGRITVSKEVPTRAETSEVTIDVDAVRGATVNAPPRGGGRGWLHLAVVGGSPAPPTELAAANDPYTLPIGPRATGASRRFARLVEKHVAERGMPKERGPNEGRYSSGVSITPPEPAEPDGSRQPQDRDVSVYLRELEDLRAVGALTDEEVARARARILG